MSWRTNTLVVRLRSIGRVTGLNKLIVSLLGSESYEDKFQKMMLSSIRSGDCVWDIGANLGLYTTKFSKLVGNKGNVYAFEPSPVNLELLKEAVGDRTNVVIVPVALGAKEMTVTFQQGEDPIGATSKIVSETSEASGRIGVKVEMVCGDELVSSNRAMPPDMIKIDTEGFELDVLKGLSVTINSLILRTLCIEVHFGLLQERGLNDAPSQIEQILESAGFEYSWPDASHIVANRV